LHYIECKTVLKNEKASYIIHLMLFDIGQHIRQTRKKRRLSQAELAMALGMSRTTIGQIENGTVQEVGVRKLIRILDYLGLELRVRNAGAPPTLEELREEADG
jgi:transcriptional regulator with XRE-family HTH domain